MNRFFLKAIFAVEDILVHPYLFRAIMMLEHTNDNTALRISESIRDAFYRRPGEHERNLMTVIEERRSLLESSNETVEIIDFGARATSPDGTVVRRILGDVASKASKQKRWASLLFYLVKRLLPERCLEFGTCIGISSLYQSAALTLCGGGTIVTMEGSETLATIAQRNFTDLKCTNIISHIGKFDAILDGVLSSYQPFDFVFLDGHHDGKFTLRYFDKLLPCVAHNAVVIIDDIRWSKNMKEAWNMVINHPRVKYSVDLHQLGIIIVS